MNRRNLLKVGSLAVLGTTIGPGIILLQTRAEAGGGHHDHKHENASSKNRWGMIIDSNKCTKDCTACTDSCRWENNVPLFGDDKIDAHWIRKATLTAKNGSHEKTYLPLLCNHCENAPCQHVCPVKATFTRKDGVVLVDAHRCIGCRYCMVACPYKARSFVFKTTTEWTNPNTPKLQKGVVGKCNFCFHRIDTGRLPACVEACYEKGEKAMIFGNLNDPNSEISQYLKKYATKQVRQELGLKPKVYYRGI